MTKPNAKGKSGGGKQSITLKADLEFTVEPVAFEPSTNLDHIDVSRLSKRRAKIEAGEFVGSCCSTKVYGIAEGGIVRKLEFSKCKGSKRPSKSLEAVVTKAIAAIKPSMGGSFNPMPVSNFIASARRRFIDIDIGGGCIIICIFDSCIYCCVLDGVPICGEPIVVKG
ncbi:MAG TPA: hypothetical protein VFR36_03990 [Sphingomicrobium sp.]|nr:hypothetical protein [Sphingomicrobium sp.]